jgi:hypothetical protein
MKTLDPKQIVIIFGADIIQGYADGSFVTVDRNEDSWNLSVGADGEGTRTKSNNKSGQITLTLAQSSQSNQILSQAALADELDNAGLRPILIKDNLGTSLYSAELAYVKKPAASEFSNESTNREWIIETDNLQMFIGGN